MKVVAWVPIKMNNERLPGKNVLPLGGKPLCQHVLGELLKLDNVDEVYAFCSEAELDNYLPDGVERIPRDESLNSFSTKINDVILAFSKVVDADIYVYAQVTSPFLKKDSIEKGLKAVLSGEYDSALSVKLLRDFLWKDKTQPLNYNPADIARTQDLEPYYQETGGFYIYRKELIQKENRRTGHKPYLVELSEIESVDIDYREDYELAQSIVLKDCGRVNDIFNVGLFAKWASYAENGGSVNDYFAINKIKTCAIYGVGVIGKSILKELNDKNVKVLYLIDRSKEMVGNIPCYLPEEVKNAENVDVIIITPGFDEETIKRSLKDVSSKMINVQELFDDVNLFKKKFFKDEYSLNQYSINEKTWNESILAYNELVNRLKFWSDNNYITDYTKYMCECIARKDVVLPQIDLVITTKCSLKCKKCFYAITEYGKKMKPFDVDVDSIIKDFERLISSVDFIVKVNLLGGEPFLYKDFDVLINKLASCNKVGQFLIVTNSTIIPSDSICKLLSNKKFFVYMNNYHTSHEHINEITNKFDQFDVMYEVANDRYWYDFGEVRKHNMSIQELEDHFERCDYSFCKSLMNGKLYVCGFQNHREKLGMIPEFNEAIDLYSCSENDLRKKIIDFYCQSYFEVCDYCNGPNKTLSKRIVAGEQE